MKYKLYAGLSGGFGGANYQGIYEFNSEDEATHAAYELAVEEYESYEGCHGIASWADCKEDCYDSGWITEDMTEDEISEMVDDQYRESIEGWIEYYAILSHGAAEDD